MAGRNPFTRVLDWLGRSGREPQRHDGAPGPEQPAPLRIGDVADRQQATLRGRVSVLTLRPRSGTPWLEAVVSDGTAEITVIWMGRREIPGVVAGRDLRLTGRVSWVDGRRRMYNPYYELL